MTTVIWLEKFIGSISGRHTAACVHVDPQSGGVHLGAVHTIIWLILGAFLTCHASRTF